VGFARQIFDEWQGNIFGAIKNCGRLNSKAGVGHLSRGLVAVKEWNHTHDKAIPGSSSATVEASTFSLFHLL
jgi:hypothetical protein